MTGGPIREHIGALKDFIVPDKRTAIDQRTYEDLMEQFKRDGYVRTVLSLPSDKQHLIVPFLKWVGDQKEFWSPYDHNFMVRSEWFDESQHSLSIWSHPGNQQNQDWTWHISAGPRKSCQIGIYKFEHLKFLPLFKMDIISILFHWPAEGKTGHNGLYPKTIPGPGNGLLTEDHWEDLARAVRMNQFKQFSFNVNRVHTKEDGHTRLHDREPDELFTIKPFADAIRQTTVLNYFHVWGWLSLRNLEYLLVHGIAPNHSITELKIGSDHTSSYQFHSDLWGHTPLVS